MLQVDKARGPKTIRDWRQEREFEARHNKNYQCDAWQSGTISTSPFKRHGTL